MIHEVQKETSRFHMACAVRLFLLIARMWYLQIVKGDALRQSLKATGSASRRLNPSGD